MSHYILGINCAYHESSACILKDGQLVAFIEEERLNRRKRGKAATVRSADEIPINSIQHCLKASNIDFSALDHFAYNLNPELRLKQSVGVDGNNKITAGSWGTLEGERAFFECNLNVIKKLNALAGRNIKDNFHFVKHHSAHAAGTFYSSGFSSAAILVIDGIGESKSAWIGAGDDQVLTQHHEIDYPHSLGFVWEKFSEYLGFSEYDAEKVMGLAAYGDPTKRLAAMGLCIDTTPENSFRVDNEILLFRTDDFSALEELFKLPRRITGEEISQAHKDIAAALQFITEEIVVKLAKTAKTLTANTRLCMAGGTALNVVANARVAQSNLFDEIYIQPPANDAGGAIGAAFYVFTQVLKKGKPNSVPHSYLGPRFSNDEIETELARTDKLDYSYIEAIEKHAAALLNSGNLIAWFHGPMEAGPRALGHRSLLADPRRNDVLELINQKVKRREYFRPLAPSVLEEHAAEWFELGNGVYDPMYYMLMAVHAKEQKRHLVPAVVHIDGTSRIQLVNQNTSPRYWRLIAEFMELTAVPMVLNTSFNVQEPIVCSPTDAIKTFLGSGIDYLIMENYVCKRRNSLSSSGAKSTIPCN